jgi:hypothetical protein
VCIVRRATSEGSTTTGEPGSVSVSAAASTEEADSGSQIRRFENYEVVLDETGKPIELGRGAMGVTSIPRISLVSDSTKGYSER